MKLASLKKEATSFLDSYKNQNPEAYAAAQQAVGGLLVLDGLIGIDNPFGGKDRPGVFGAFIGIFVGIAFLFIPTFFGNITGISKMTATTTATVVSVDKNESTTTNSDGSKASSTTCTATATYKVNGKQYTQQASNGADSMCSFSEGQNINIYYNPENPGAWTNDVKTVGLIMKIFFIAGIVIIISSLFTFIIRLLSIIFGWKLIRSGRALAKTLPEGTDLSTVIKEMQNSFKGSIFGFNANQGQQAISQVPGYPSQNAPQQTSPAPQAQQVITQQPTNNDIAEANLTSAPVQPVQEQPPSTEPPEQPINRG